MRPTSPESLADSRTRWYCRPDARTWRCPPPSTDPAEFHRSFPEFGPTPLVRLPTLAAELGVAEVFVKDESSRLGLPSFKCLGAWWATHRALERRAGGARLEPSLAGTRAAIDRAGPVRLFTATDGNHGHAVARIAAKLGVPAHIFIPVDVGEAAKRAIGADGPDITVVDDHYDRTVAAAAAAAAQDPIGVLVQDTSWPGYEEVAGWIVDGYSTLFAELAAQLKDAGIGHPDLVAVPVGVGSLAQAAVAAFRSGPADVVGPVLLSVEPEAAPCVLTSLHEGRLTGVRTGTTAMDGLNCGTPSTVAWPFLRDGIDAAVAVGERAADDAVDDLRRLGVSAGHCGAATLAGVRAALVGDHERRGQLGTDPHATVVLLNTEAGAR